MLVGVGACARRIRSAGVAVLVLLAACQTSGGSSSPGTGPTTAGTGAPTSTTGPTTIVPPPEITAPEITAKDFDPASFADPTTIDNTWFPLVPGTMFVYRGSTREGDRRIPHRGVFAVTDLTKVIDGVRAVVVWDRDWTDGELEESELALFAQDDAGNVWHLGQYPEVYEDGELVETPTWFHGIEGARAGITMKAEPRRGGPSYAQGFAPPPISWVDRAQVYRTGQRTCVPAGCYDDVLVTEEFERTKPDAFQLKFYAPGVGNVRVGWRGAGEDERETLVLVRTATLDAEALARIRARALALERRAYRISTDVYALTEPAEPA